MELLWKYENMEKARVICANPIYGYARKKYGDEGKTIRRWHILKRDKLSLNIATGFVSEMTIHLFYALGRIYIFDQKMRIFLKSF